MDHNGTPDWYKVKETVYNRRNIFIDIRDNYCSQKNCELLMVCAPPGPGPFLLTPPRNRCTAPSLIPSNTSGTLQNRILGLNFILPSHCLKNQQELSQDMHSRLFTITLHFQLCSYFQIISFPAIIHIIVYSLCINVVKMLVCERHL